MDNFIYGDIVAVKMVEGDEEIVMIVGAKNERDPETGLVKRVKYKTKDANRENWNLGLDNEARKVTDIFEVMKRL